ncbi:hypothetical protein GCM10009789_02830 [Kribbella sancticallisti]|uniref:Uncharacterized protein n=1 Tax=Kribbella sancticallisti TaxID=460087 RepID=A0ABN2C5A2_9ACTN
MATLTVWKFPSAKGAEEAERTLEVLQRQELIRVHVFKGLQAELIHTNLSTDQEARLREIFGE